MSILRKFGVESKVSFPAIDYGGTDYIASGEGMFTTGDVKISKDEGGFISSINLPVHLGNGMYSLTLTSGELGAARVVVVIIDQSSTKEWEDQSFAVDTYGDASAQHEFDLDAASVTVGDLSTASANLIADHTIRRSFQNAADSADGDAKTGRSMLGAIAKLVNKITISGAVLHIYEDDDVTQLFAQIVASQPGADPITGLDTSD